MRHVTHMNEACHTHEWGMSHTWMRHVTHMNEACHTHECGMSHTWMRHVTHMNEACHTHEWGMSHIWMRAFNKNGDDSDMRTCVSGNERRRIIKIDGHHTCNCIPAHIQMYTCTHTCNTNTSSSSSLKNTFYTDKILIKYTIQFFCRPT